MNSKLIGLLLISLSYCINVIGQDTQPIYRTVETMPQSPYDVGQYLADHAQYPKAAADSGIQGKLYVQFVVEPDSSISNVKIIKGAQMGGGLPEEAERLVSNMPKWAPGLHNGIPVRVYFTMPVSFTLDQESDTTIWRVLTQMPRAPYDWNTYVSRNLRYPGSPSRKSFQGKVYVSFIVEKDGSISNVHVGKGADLGGGLPEEAMRLIKNMPKWTPGMQNGVPVRAFFTVPINFVLM